MRKIILSAIIATVAAISFAAPSQAGGYDNNYGNDSGYGHQKHYKKHYQQDDYYEPTCYYKKVKRWDSYGNLVIKRVKVCE